MLQNLAPDIELSADRALPRAGLQRGEEARAAVVDLCREVRMDLTHKQLTRERATWTVRFVGGDALGSIEAEVAGGQRRRLRLGPAPD